jgi:hypothetical protein
VTCALAGCAQPFVGELLDDVTCVDIVVTVTVVTESALSSIVGDMVVAAVIFKLTDGIDSDELNSDLNEN